MTWHFSSRMGQRRIIFEEELLARELGHWAIAYNQFFLKSKPREDQIKQERNSVTVNVEMRRIVGSNFDKYKDRC